MFIKVFNSSGTEIPVPTPARGLTYQGQQLVDSARNANGVVVAQKINRRLIKLDNLEWKYLTDDQWHEILVAINGFVGYVEFYDPVSQHRKRMKFYWGDYEATPFMTDPEHGTVKTWINCKCNIIDMGLPMTTVEG
jgi:hypothetical protein